MITSGLVEDIFIIAAETALLILFLRISLDRRWRLPPAFILLAGLQFFRRLFIIGTASLVLSYALDMIVTVCAFHGKPEKKMFLLSLFYAAVFVFDMSSIMLVTPLLHWLPAAFPHETDLLYPATVLSKAMTLILMLIAGDALKNKIHVPKWLAYVPLPALTVIGIALLNPLTGEVANSTVAILMTVICVIGVFAHAYMLISIRRAARYAELDYRLKLTEENKALRRQHIQELQEAYRQIERTAHDLKHHLNYIRSAPDLAAVQRYVDEIDSRSFPDVLHYTGNFDVDTILNAKRHELKKATLAVRGVLPAEIDWLDPVDVSILLGNALDNAIEACERCGGGEIVVTFKYDGWLLFSVENPTDRAPVRKMYGFGFMSTKSGPGHGIGMESMELAVKRYDGHMEYEVTDGVFRLNIMLQ